MHAGIVRGLMTERLPGLRELALTARGLIFDCDGTLADTMPAHMQAWKDAFAACGTACDEGFLLPFSGVPSRMIVRAFNERFGTELDPEAVGAGKRARVRPLLAGALPIRPVAELALSMHGRMPMAVASGGTRDDVEATLNAIGLLHIFDSIVTADDDVEPKPGPGVFLEAARRIRVAPSDCLVFEDGEAGFEAARRAGMRFVDVTPYRACAFRSDRVADLST